MNDVISDIGRTHLTWALTDGVGPIVFSRLLTYFGDAETALGVSAGALEQVHGIGRGKADKIARARDSATIEDEIRAAADEGIRIICRADPEYPPGLKEIPDAPIVLYIRVIIATPTPSPSAWSARAAARSTAASRPGGSASCWPRQDLLS